VRDRIDVEHATEPRGVERDDAGVVAANGGLDTTNDRRSAAKGDDRDTMLDRDPQQCGHVDRATRIYDRIGSRVELPAAEANEVKVGATDGVVDTLVMVRQHVVGADRRAQLGHHRLCEFRRGNGDLFNRSRRRVREPRQPDRVGQEFEEELVFAVQIEVAPDCTPTIPLQIPSSK
jgi:hypothetical protein